MLVVNVWFCPAFVSIMLPLLGFVLELSPSASADDVAGDMAEEGEGVVTDDVACVVELVPVSDEAASEVLASGG